ncbi:MAG: Putative auxin-regulated protein, partial [Anaerolinea thermophila]
MVTPSENPLQIMQRMVEPWLHAVQDPIVAQQAVFQQNLAIYAQTTYGKQHGAAAITNIEAYRQAFPARDYEYFKPLIQQVMAGDTQLLLNEEPVGWAITRGTTKGENKFIPMTATDLKMRVSAGRAVVNYALQSKRFDIFQGVNLNLNFPSVVGHLQIGDRKLAYGYSSGIYTKHVSNITPVRSLPSQDEIDGLGGGKTMRDWEARFDLAYQKCLHENVTLVGGVAPTALQFGKYMHRKHKQLPREVWQVIVMTLGSVPGINTRLAD